MQNEDDNFQKLSEKRKKYNRGFDSDRSDVNIEGDIKHMQFEEDN